MKFSAVIFLSVAAATALSAQTKPAAPARTKPAGAAKAKPAAAKPAASSTAATPASTPTSGDAKPVMTIGNETVSAKEFDELIEALPEQARAQARGPMKRQMAEQIVRVKLLAAEARRKGLDKDPGVQARIRFQTENLLAGAAYNDFTKTANVDEPALRKYYEEHKGEYESVAAKHILIKYKGSPVPNREGKTELSEEQALAKAQEIRKKLQGGEDFAKLAKEESDDTGSGANGGDLGTFTRGQMVPEFEKAAFSLKPGDLSEPVKTQFGYHVIKVDKHDAKSFEDVRPEIEGRMRPEAARESVEQLRKNATVTLDETYFGPANPPAGAVTAPGTPTPQQ